MSNRYFTYILQFTRSEYYADEVDEFLEQVPQRLVDPPWNSDEAIRNNYTVRDIIP